MLIKQGGTWRNIYASPLATAPGVINHGADGTVSRPSGYAYIVWRGDAEPANAVADDIWIPDNVDSQHNHDSLYTPLAHKNNTSNPHSVTASQAGAVDLGGDTMTGLLTIDGGGVYPTLGDDFATASGNPDLYPSGYTSFRDAQGSFPAGTNGAVETFNPFGGANVLQRNWQSDMTRVFWRLAIDGTTWTRWFVNGVSVCYVTLATNQTVANTTNEIVLFDNVVEDPFSMFDSTNNKIDIPWTGWWLITTSQRWSGNSNGDYRYSRINRVGDNYLTYTSVPPGGNSSDFGVESTIARPLGSGNGINVEVRQDSGGDLTLEGNRWTAFSAVYLGDTR